ncbi:MAG: hypothetical protein HY287_04615 [Planctomycetes bacterium]|nr:hypothetical protein [Planctomycetota bacterium]MBI3833597.1 hypothetical protein [Planctomycetota bacterium]
MLQTRNVKLVLANFTLLWCNNVRGGPDLTIYNQEFAVVRDTVPLELAKGANEVRFTNITAHAETDSIILRDPAGKTKFQIVEQNYIADPLSQALLLSQSEGKTLEFQVIRQGQAPEIVQGKLIRSAYVMHNSGIRRYGQQYYSGQSAYGGYDGSMNEPIVEVNGKLQFGLPGTPLFPPLASDAILKPTIHWIIETESPGKLDAEVTYVTGGMSWEADYNLVSPKDSDELELIGWVTMDNQSGKGFENARIKLMAGDVNKLRRDHSGGGGGGQSLFGGSGTPPVTEQSFDEYHLYTLQCPTSLLDRETKQVEFLRAGQISSKRVYVYDGMKVDRSRYSGPPGNYGTESNYGIESNPKVWVMREFANTAENQLGMPLPKGRLRLYRRGDDQRLEFIGENMIDHTPLDEVVRVYTGNAFDLVGNRIRTDFNLDYGKGWIDESVEITLNNHKNEPVDLRVVEHIYRASNWEIKNESQPHEKKDAETIYFQVAILANQSAKVSYTVHYFWKTVENE